MQDFDVLDAIKITDPIRLRYIQLNDLITYPEIAIDTKQLLRITNELNQIRKAALLNIELHKQIELLDSTNKELNVISDDELIIEFKKEIESIENNINKILSDILTTTLNEHIDAFNGAIIEIKPIDNKNNKNSFKLFNTYLNFAKYNSLKYEDLSQNDDNCLKIIGVGVYSKFYKEIGTHAFMSKDTTDYCNVMVLPYNEKTNIEINDKNVRIDVYHSSGAGGQNVNKVETAIRLTHIPTGIVVTCQDERSQKQNKEKAYELLKEKLDEKNSLTESTEQSKLRKDAMKLYNVKKPIRVYDFTQDKVIDNRCNKQFTLTNIMNGNLDELFNILIRTDEDK